MARIESKDQQSKVSQGIRDRVLALFSPRPILWRRFELCVVQLSFKKARMVNRISGDSSQIGARRIDSFRIQDRETIQKGGIQFKILKNSEHR